MELTKQYTEEATFNLEGVKSILRDKYVSIVEKGKVIFFVIDESGVIRYASDYVSEILDYTPADLNGKKFVDIIEPASIPFFNKTVQQLKLNTSEPAYFKDLGLYCVSCNKHYFDGMITNSEISSESHLVIYMHDVTDRKINEETLTQTNLELDGFIYKASHDLRSPLASLTGLINLTEKSISAENKEYIELMKRSINRLDQYITKLAHYTRNSNMGNEYVEINFTALLNDIIESYRFLPNAERINFRVFVNEDQKIHADLFRLQLVLNNLISNAIKYQNPQEANPFIEIHLTGDRKKFKLIVNDNGIGISDEYKDKIFNMFQRATTQAQGSGIGLYLVKKALLKMKGEIDVDSTYGKGTKFTLTIPNHIADCKPVESNPMFKGAEIN